MRLVREELATLNYWLVWHSCFFHLHVCYIAYSELGLWFDTELENNCVVTIRHGSSSLLVSDPPLLHPVILLRLGFVYRFLEKKRKQESAECCWVQGIFLKKSCIASLSSQQYTFTVGRIVYFVTIFSYKISCFFSNYFSLGLSSSLGM